MPKLNRYNDGGFVYGQWREVGRRVDPVTGDIIITERREGSRDVKYDTRGVSWRKGYEDWLAAGNEGTMEDFKLEAEAWKRSQDKKEFDSQNRERRIKRKEEVEGDDEGKPSDDPRPDDFVGDSPGGGGPGGGGGSGDVSRPGKEDAGNEGPVVRPRKPVQVDLPDQSYQGLRYPGSGSFIPPGQGQTLSDEEVDRLVAEGVLPPPSTLYPPEFFGEVLIEDDIPLEPRDVNVEFETTLETDVRPTRLSSMFPNLFDRNVVTETFKHDATNTYDDEVIHRNITQTSRQKDGRKKKTSGTDLFEIYDSEGNRTFKEEKELKKGGLVPNNNRNNMYHNKKEMGMGGMNMPRLMKKSMPGGGMVSPMEREMGMGGRMEMGHGGDMERAVKIYLMKKGGKTAFPDLTGDGKVTFADILKGRLRKGKKKSQAYGGKVMREGGEVEYGIGGAILGGINALREGKGLGGAAMAAGKGFVTPGSGIAAGAKLAGGLLAGSQNPALAGIGKVAGMASNFLPGGGGPAGAIGQLMQMRQAEMGMMVPRRQMMGR